MFPHQSASENIFGKIKNLVHRKYTLIFREKNLDSITPTFEGPEIAFLLVTSRKRKSEQIDYFAIYTVLSTTRFLQKTSNLL